MTRGCSNRSSRSLPNRRICGGLRMLSATTWPSRALLAGPRRFASNAPFASTTPRPTLWTWISRILPAPIHSPTMRGDRPDLVQFIERRSLDPHHQLDQWVHSFLRKGGSTNTRALLVNLTRTIKQTFTYVARHEQGIQHPLLTLKLRSGSCRDLAMLMIEAVRSLGMAARFVSGYLHVR